VQRNVSQMCHLPPAPAAVLTKQHPPQAGLTRETDRRVYILVGCALPRGFGVWKVLLRQHRSQKAEICAPRVRMP